MKECNSPSVFMKANNSWACDSKTKYFVCNLGVINKLLVPVVLQYFTDSLLIELDSESDSICINIHQLHQTSIHQTN